MGGSRRDEAKSLPITKGMVYDAYLTVRRQGGRAPGVDGMSFAELEADLGNQLYKLWNRLSSGSYPPPAVRRVNIAKRGGGQRPLGIPTLLDRIAQQVVKQYLEPQLESHFHRWSYGYRPGRDAHQALAACRANCWRRDWVIDLDIKGFFDNIDHSKLLLALRRHCQQNWVMMYVQRWLEAEVELPGGQRQRRHHGTPQGGVISPLLANLYLHYAFDRWMEQQHGLAFERYADDIIIHCSTEAQARRVLISLAERFKAVGLTLHPTKTKIVYCGKGSTPGGKGRVDRKFSFLGYEFKPGRAFSHRDQRAFTACKAVASGQAKQDMRAVLRQTIRSQPGSSLQHWARLLNAKVRGWLRYYSKFNKWELGGVMDGLNTRLKRWVVKHYRRFKGSLRRATLWLRRVYRHQPKLFAHWAWGFKP